MEPEKEPSLSARILTWLRHLRDIVISFWAFVLSLFSKLRTRPKDSKQKSDSSCNKFLKWGNFVVQALIFLAASFYGAISYRQWRSQLDAMRIDERAWVSADVGEKTGNFSISMHNTGKTPALKVTYVAGFQGGKRGVIPEVDLSRNSSSPFPVPKNISPQMREILTKQGVIRDVPPTGYVIAPNASQIASDYQGRFLQIFRMDGERAYVQGRITYDDVFGKNHETLFCYWAELPQGPIVGVAPPSDFLMCNDHNKMD